MPPIVFRMVLIFGLIFILNTIRLTFSGRAVKNKVEKPSIIQRVALGIQVALTFLMVFMALLGVL